MPPTSIRRSVIRVRGTVQGVGFRPAVYRLAVGQGLSGSVRNDASGVWIDIEGAAEAVERFPALLREQAPPLACIEALEVSTVAPGVGAGFRVLASEVAVSATAAIPADVATCEGCLRELRDPADRRHRYPFINCTDCGPRYSIALSVPWDRRRTTMGAFELCSHCRAEYEDPLSRRFHAEPNGCPACGPRLQFVERGRATLSGAAALERAIEALVGETIVAVKGLGGFFLAVDATNERAVTRLRERKRRPHKPLALMARDLDEVHRIAHLSPVEQKALLSPQRPIVLLRARRDSGIAPSVAPGLEEWGVMLPYTPLHHLLVAGPLQILVMTSANLVDAPIEFENDAALDRLAGIADAFLLHDRDIHTRVDDSVVRVVAGAARMVRRARGFVPAPVELPDVAPPVLAVGAELKNTLCLASGGRAWLSQHHGDLSNLATIGFFEETRRKLESLLGFTPRWVAHDLHPDYASTRWALGSGLPRIAVQHHHAHIASCLAEHGRIGPVIGVAFDGTGCGLGGELWGGEFLVADLGSFRRFAHLRPLALPGGEAAIRAPWRLACAALLDAELPGDELLSRSPLELRRVRQLIRQGIATPHATSAGRWFDAVAALLGIGEEISWEGQAAVMLEAITRSAPVDGYPFTRAGAEIDLRPVIRGVVDDLRRDVPAEVIAARFHETFAQIVSRTAGEARASTGLTTVALSGGCFQNRRLTERSLSLLEGAGFEVLLHRRVPPNDGGIALGQAAVASHRLRAQQTGVEHVSGHTG